MERKRGEIFAFSKSNIYGAREINKGRGIIQKDRRESGKAKAHDA
jgi:hypothetical protein